ncbi:MAG: hypothetical protein HYS98_05975 [Deltaproteobacteria bacterium]|nr:hypothetical protein [Deltaproteobacteria bacterium]
MKKLLLLCVLGVLVVSGFSFALPQNVEDAVQQLDWDIARSGPLGRKYRNIAVKKLSCLGNWGHDERKRVLETTGRLLGHENQAVIRSLWDLMDHLKVQMKEISKYEQKILIYSRHLENDQDVQEALVRLTEYELEGIEIINEFYPLDMDVRYLNELSKKYTLATQKILKVRLRTLSSVEPTILEKIRISSITAIVETDFHIFKERVPTDFLCQPTGVIEIEEK